MPSNKAKRRKSKQPSDGYVFNDDGSPRVYAKQSKPVSKARPTKSTKAKKAVQPKSAEWWETSPKQRKRASLMAMLRRRKPKRIGPPDNPSLLQDVNGYQREPAFYHDENGKPRKMADMQKDVDKERRVVLKQLRKIEAARKRGDLGR